MTKAPDFERPTRRARVPGRVSALPGRLNVDGFMVALLATVVVASLLPASAGLAPSLDIIVTGAIALLFFLYGARMHPTEALEGLKHWRLHTTILSFTYLVFPVIGIALRVLEPALLSRDLYTGLLFLTLVPSTVQSSIAFTSIARGNVAGAMVSASASNLLGIFLTPALVVLMSALHVLDSSTSGGGVTLGAVTHICLELLVPFAVGQLARPWIGEWITTHKKPLKLVDRGSIILVVYAAFSEGMRQHIWSIVRPGQIVFLVTLSLVLVVVLLWGTRAAARRLEFDRADTIAVQFCGTKKSLATGLPMAAVLFSGPSVGMVVLPLMIFHQVQLFACSWLASRYSRATSA